MMSFYCIRFLYRINLNIFIYNIALNCIYEKTVSHMVIMLGLCCCYYGLSLYDVGAISKQIARSGELLFKAYSALPDGTGDVTGQN